MKTKRLCLIILLLIIQTAVADVPSSLTRQPAVPDFISTYKFKTIEMNLFSSDVTGMLIDDYGDLAWNPAFLSAIQKKKIYLDLDFGNYSTTAASPYYTNSDYLVSPSWYSQTSIAGVQSVPLYNLAILMPLTEKLKTGLINRSNFDYGPFRETYYWDYYYLSNDSYWGAMELSDALVPERIEVDDNQQTMYSVQTDLMASYQLTKKLDLGVKIGNYIFRRYGDLYDTKWGTYPHSRFADLNDEDLDINGDQYTVGLGLMYHINDKSKVGIYGELITGQSDESSASVDSSYSWSEHETDDDYFSFYDYDMAMEQNCDADATRKTFTLTYESQVSDVLTFRAFIKYSGSESDIDLSSSSRDTTFRDRTYDTYYDNYQRRIQHYAERQSFSGEGTEKSSYWNGFVSLVYKPEDEWSMFGGIQYVISQNEARHIDNSTYYYSYDYEYRHYEPRTYKYLDTHEKYYEYTSETNLIALNIPLGLNLEVAKGFHLIFAGELHYYLTDSWEKGRLLYPDIQSKIWEDGVLVADDPEEDRYEEYSSEPAKALTRSTNINIGASYKHPSGINIYVRSSGDVLETTNWDIGLEYQW